MGLTRGNFGGYVQFARFAIAQKVDPSELAHLYLLAQRAFRAGEAYCSFPGKEKALNKAQSEFAVQALRLGFDVKWPGLWPTLVDKDGQFVELPSI